MFSLAEEAFKAVDAIKKFSDAMSKIKMDKRLRRVSQVSCKYKGRQIRL